jgi:predicted nucleic acid-binding protein
MVVVADSSPIIVLINIGHIGVLPTMFGEVAIPPEVSAELHSVDRPSAVRNFAAQPPAWLVERAPSRIEPIPALHAGELAAISLALELKAELLLIDELSGREAAAARKIPLTGTVGILELAAEKGLLDLQDAFDRLKQTDFWISHELLDQRLRLYLASKKHA